MSPTGAAADGRPVPMGVIGETGETHPPLTSIDAALLAAESPAVQARAVRTRALALEGRVDDPMALDQAGWGVVFAADADPAIREALRPLLDLRRHQVGDDRYFKIFDGAGGVRAGETAASWAVRHEVSLSAPVSPRKGVPYYLLLVGSPTAISFEFQAQVDLQWAVGRLHFDTIEEYGAYARHVVDTEIGSAPAPSRQLAVWVPRNPLDLATAMLAGSIGPEFLGRSAPGDDPLGTYQKFALAMHVGEGQATKAQLARLLGGTAADHRPAIVFTGSHGAEWSIDTPDVQRARQGALVTQEWTRGQPLGVDQTFAAADVPVGADLRGQMVFLFACFGGGCPTVDSYYRATNGSPKPLAPAPLIARLPQTLLGRGALAVIAHVDRAFSYAFEDVMGTPQAQLLRTPLELLMKGRRAGLAADPLNLQWSALAAQLGMALDALPAGTDATRVPRIANLSVARDDARNYVVLGDPATRLPIERMAGA